MAGPDTGPAEPRVTPAVATLRPLGDTGSRVTLAVDYTFASGALQAVMAPVFGHITGTLVEHFVQRAEEIA